MVSQKPSPAAHILNRREYSGPLFLKQGFRPFFFGAGLYSAVSMAIWLVFLTQGNDSGFFTYTSPVDWHIHEMLYGFLPAAVAGFLLTAVPNWTGRLPVRGFPLLLLVLIWLSGRLSFLIQGFVSVSSHIFLAITDSLFLVIFAALLAREILSGNNWKNVPVVLIVTALAFSNILFHLSLLEIIATLSTNTIAMAGILLTVLLVTLIGGRITPSFTRNWMVQNKITSLPASQDNIDKGGALLVAIASLILLITPGTILAALFSIAAAILHSYRLSRWHGLFTVKEPIVFILHVGYGWIGIGFLLAGLSILIEEIPQVAAIHAFTAGMMGSMILAVMTRATRGHTGNKLAADWGTSLIYILVVLSAIFRILSSIFGFDDIGYTLSAIGWIASFGLFSLLYLPMFLSK